LLIKKKKYEGYYLDNSRNKIIGINLSDILSTRDIFSQKISNIGKKIVWLSKDNSISEASRIMSYNRSRSLPLFEDNKIIGQITSVGIVKALERLDLKIPCSRIMTPSPMNLESDDSLSSAKNRMIRNRIDHLPIIDKQLSGIITSANIIKTMLGSENHGSRLLSFPVKSIAEKNMLTINVQENVSSCIKLLNQSNSTYVLVTQGEELQGIITHRDIMMLLGERIEEDIPAYIIGLPDEPFIAELAKSKFNSIVKLLKKVLPDIEEARCRIKLKKVRGKVKRYEIDVNIFTTSERFSYSNNGSDLANIFDQMIEGMKKKLSQKKQKRQKISKRYSLD
jgi:CBS domain-containing protein/ribosome-associated translation inhibitor RaiA